jgi:hypothetical protein
MRALTMPAGDVGGVDPAHAGGLLGWLGGAVTAGLGAFGLWLANRTLGRAAFQTAMNDGFSKLTDQLQEERKEMQARWDAERIAWAAERAQLRGEIINLTQAVESLKSLLRRSGIQVPDIRTPPADYVVLGKSDDGEGRT